MDHFSAHQERLVHDSSKRINSEIKWMKEISFIFLLSKQMLIMLLRQIYSVTNAITGTPF